MNKGRERLGSVRGGIGTQAVDLKAHASDPRSTRLTSLKAGETGHSAYTLWENLCCG